MVGPSGLASLCSLHRHSHINSEVFGVNSWWGRHRSISTTAVLMLHPVLHQHLETIPPPITSTPVVRHRDKLWYHTCYQIILTPSFSVLLFLQYIHMEYIMFLSDFYPVFNRGVGKYCIQSASVPTCPISPYIMQYHKFRCNLLQDIGVIDTSGIQVPWQHGIEQYSKRLL